MLDDVSDQELTEEVNNRGGVVIWDDNPSPEIQNYLKEALTQIT